MRTHLDLFSGIGGFALAAQWNGLETVGFCEIEPYAQKVLIEKFGAVLADANSEHGRRREQQDKSPGDGCGKEGGKAIASGGSTLHSDIFAIRGTDYAGVDLITGGFPCQPFSCAGKRGGASDDRHLWPEMLRVIDEARPAWVLAENVPGIIGMELDAVLSDLENIGYACWSVIVPACAVDARHRRDRVWIMAHADGGKHRSGSAQSGQRTLAGCDGEENRTLANANRTGSQGRDGSELRKRGTERTSGPGYSPVSDSHGGGCTQQQELDGGSIQNSTNGDSRRGHADGCGGPARWEPEPQLGRVAHGIPNRSHRLKGLGNAIVPQVAAQLIAMMIAAERQAP